MKKLQYLYIFIMFASISCEKFVDVDPPITSPVADVIFKEDQTAISVLTGIYTKINEGTIIYPQTIPSLSLYLGLASDEFKLSPDAYTTQPLGYYQNALGSNGPGSEYWSTCYSHIYICNDAIENLEKAPL